MAEIEEKYFQQLRDAGLFVWFLFGDSKTRVLVGKPSSTPGNCIPGFKDSHIAIAPAPLPPEMDAPTVMLELRDDKVWQVVAVEFIGGASSSDFVNEWFTGEEAVSDILDFYFGDPKRMEAKATALNSSR